VGLIGFKSRPLKAGYEQAMIGSCAQRLMGILPPITVQNNKPAALGVDMRVVETYPLPARDINRTYAQCVCGPFQ
jgi:hypothetical protein